jgi:hypothetical protein
LRALHGRGERRSPGHGRPQDALTIETIVLVTFYEIINLDGFVKSPSAALRCNFVVAAHS